MHRPLALATLSVLALSLATSCSDAPAAPADVEHFQVEHEGQRLALTQRFDDEGELVETRVMHRRDGGERVIRALGPLVTGAGATDGGNRIRGFFATLDPALLARLHQAGLRYDLAVLAADAMLALDGDERRRAARALSAEGDAELCVLLDACGDHEGAPQT